MIIDPKTLEAAPEPQDAPPAYEQATTSSSAVPEKRPEPTGPSTPNAAQLGLGFGSKAKVPSSPTASAWFWSSFGMASKTDKDVKATVLGLVRDLVKAGSSPDAISILQSCSEACRARSLSLEAILQEPSIEGHTPLYWAILKDPAPSEGQISLVDLLMSFPLTPASIQDARQACLLNSDDTVFQRLRRSPGCAGLSPTDELLLGSPPQDRVVVENAEGDHGAFKVTLHFVHFQKRMRVSRTVRAEFIARAGSADGRQYKPGSWIVAVGLVDKSPMTHLDSRLVINPLSTLTTIKSDMPSASSSPSTVAGWASRMTAGTPRDGRPPIVVRLKSSSSQLGEHDFSDATRRRRAVGVLADSPGGAGLEFE
ncbi:hypothetical protein EXIGLDRAFT_703195 [Exidia glandulosa HHB12029]|uniref:Uncharacterized protein n=1 Tax=Exidia glandulosa HHB12029 TaxID=1314781 RepID=A0A165L940_EXIGL|nr:hypothetical protein EXIGLDRAFT_703195 [Exidia glandulosa HHB12029]